MSGCTIRSLFSRGSSPLLSSPRTFHFCHSTLPTIPPFLPHLTLKLLRDFCKPFLHFRSDPLPLFRFTLNCRYFSSLNRLWNNGSNVLVLTPITCPLLIDACTISSPLYLSAHCHVLRGLDSRAACTLYLFSSR